MDLKEGFHYLSLLFAGNGSSKPRVQLKWSGDHCCGGYGSCEIPHTKWCSCPPKDDDHSGHGGGHGGGGDDDGGGHSGRSRLRLNRVVG